MTKLNEMIFKKNDRRGRFDMRSQRFIDNGKKRLDLLLTTEFFVLVVIGTCMLSINLKNEAKISINLDTK